MGRANYQILVDREKFVLLNDAGPWDKHKTITNDAEHVVAEMYIDNNLGSRNLFYIDSDGDMCQLVHEAGVFKDFRPVGRLY